MNRPSGKDTTVCTPVIINIEFTLKTSLRNKFINVTTKTTKCTLYDKLYDKKLTKLLWELHSDSLDQLNTKPSVFRSGLNRSEPLTKYKVSKNADLVTCELNTDIIECNWILTRDDWCTVWLFVLYSLHCTQSRSMFDWNESFWLIDWLLFFLFSGSLDDFLLLGVVLLDG